MVRMKDRPYIWFNRNDEKFYVHTPDGRDHGGFDTILDAKLFLARKGCCISKIRLTMPLKRRPPARTLTCFKFQTKGK